jgi:hypothetical protein
MLSCLFSGIKTRLHRSGEAREGFAFISVVPFAGSSLARVVFDGVGGGL